MKKELEYVIIHLSIATGIILTGVIMNFLWDVILTFLRGCR